MQQKRNDNDEFLLLPTLIAPELTAYMQLAAAVVTTVLGWISLTLEAVSYTHLTLPTNREV